MNKIAKEFLDYIEKVSNIYLRADKIAKLDNDEKIIDKLYLITSGSVASLFMDYPIYIVCENIDNEIKLNHDGRPYELGYLLFEKFKIHIMVDPKMKYIDHRFWIHEDTSLIYTKDSFKPSEKFEVLFF